MRIGRRTENGREVRVIEWGDSDSTDLTAVLVVATAAVVSALAGVLAALTSGWPRTVFVVVTVGAGLLWVPIAVVLLIAAVVSASVRTRRPTPAAEVVMTVLSAGVGCAVGAGSYEAGGVAVLSGPVAAAAIAALVWPRLHTRAARVRLCILCAIGALAAVLVGYTVYR